jgi:hypothetical protein
VATAVAELAGSLAAAMAELAGSLAAVAGFDKGPPDRSLAGSAASLV